MKMEEAKHISVYAGTAPNLNANTGKGNYLFESNSAELVADIDYVKFSNVEQPVEPPVTPENPENPENPDTPNDDEDAPATGVAIVPVVLVIVLYAQIMDFFG